MALTTVITPVAGRRESATPAFAATNRLTSAGRRCEAEGVERAPLSPPFGRTPADERVYICERCGERMEERKCKIVCNNCGSLRDCSDP